jgi:hypothetical protein
VFFAKAGLIAVEGHVERPMQVIFDPPVVAHGLSGAFGVEGSRGDTVSGPTVGFGVAFDAGLDTDDAGDIGQAKFTGEAALAGQPIDLTQDTCGALFDAAVALAVDGVGVGRFGGRCRRGGSLTASG